VTDEERQPTSDALDRLDRLDTGTQKVSRWDRVVVHDLRWAIAFVGRTLIVIGLLMFGFVAYQLWGTGIETARAQNELESEFDALAARLEPSPVVSPPTSVAPASSVPGSRPQRTTTTTTATTTTTLPPLELGDPLGVIEIPRIGLEFYLVAGVGTEELKQGVGHYTETPMPGQLGNSAFAGHRTTYGQPFFDIDEVQPGDEIIVTTLDGRFVYRMTSQQIVSPNDYHVVTTTDPDIATLTLTSCHPQWSASERIVVTATLDAAQSSPIRGSVRSYPTSTTTTSLPATTTPRSESPSTTTASSAATVVSTPGDDAPAAPASAAQLSDEATDAFSHGWFADTAAWSQVALWAAVVAAVCVAAYLLARRVRHLWVGVLVGVVPFLVALYFFYQNVNRLLPAAL
jgi:sortase A